MELTSEDFQLFERDFFAFKQLKEFYSIEEVEQIKQEYKEHWQKWKAWQQAVAKELPTEYHMEKPKIESWTNGWNLRNHFWSAYRDPQHRNQNACLAALLNRKQFQVYLMFQHYKSDERAGSLAEYNKLLTSLHEWSKGVANIEDYYIWPQVEHELDDHLPLTEFLADNNQPQKLQAAMQDRSFQLGKLTFKATPSIVQETVQTLEELAPLYFALS
ncbi:HI_0552 family protein [Enterococcus xiangfangensis]|uniref:HI_0552 family protein n=1 Tax=Enterococcus xiangfangensis TaxID=1296537 RepID=A0ABU3FBL8_9ENTE|nr:HI_0552 family protein [Enterococcus xiangfangensis]MDT2760067.1 HI_0552 family protein [Enterococcus xiangfangensis]